MFGVLDVVMVDTCHTQSNGLEDPMAKRLGLFARLGVVTTVIYFRKWQLLSHVQRVWLLRLQINVNL